MSKDGYPSLVSQDQPNSSPMFQGSSPRVQGSSPMVQGSFPMAQGSFPMVQGSFPMAQGSVPTAQASVPMVQGSVPMVQGSFPMAQGSSPMIIPKEEMQNGTNQQAEMAVCLSKKLQNELQAMGLKVKQHEDNCKFLKGEMNKLDDMILDMHVALGKYHMTSVSMQDNEDYSHDRSEDEVVEHVLKHEKSAAAIFHQLLAHHGTQVSSLPVTKDVLGTVATLCRVDDDNLSWLLAEFLGRETMLALVSKTLDGVKVLETYDKDGLINTSSGIHGLGASIGRQLDNRYLVICLEHLRPFTGHFIVDDPQRRLDLRKPKLPNGETPPGFIGFAVNLISLDNAKLFCVTSTGHGLRETLFYNLFSSLQVYKTREDMLNAIPLINNGAVSLDGGMMKRSGIFSLGNRENVDVKFPKNFRRLNLPENYFEIENQIKEMNWKKERVVDDMRREQELLDRTKIIFDSKKQEFVKFLAESSTFMSQNHLQTARHS
ncbi:viral or transposable element protein [Lithospermum erythrorhizon]|uniref:Viral or transposable element protein n=1 Tax=Lithospermum erythrorhizon TaxID=34254 RepID=A0AAV3PG13_LITER